MRRWAALPNGRLNLLVEGRGRHALVLEMTVPLETTAARQMVSFRLPRAGAGRLRLTVPGDVEIRSGADVLGREVDSKAHVTRLELLPPLGDATLVMSLNSHLQGHERAVAAQRARGRSDRGLRKTLCHGVAGHSLSRGRSVSFRCARGFRDPRHRLAALSRWEIKCEDDRKVVNVQLREQTTDAVVLNISAVRLLCDAFGPGGLRAWLGHHLAAMLNRTGTLIICSRVAKSDRSLVHDGPGRQAGAPLGRIPGSLTPLSRPDSPGSARPTTTGAGRSHLFYSKRWPSFGWFRQQMMERFEDLEVEQFGGLPGSGVFPTCGGRLGQKGEIPRGRGGCGSSGERLAGNRRGGHEAASQGVRRQDLESAAGLRTVVVPAGCRGRSGHRHRPVKPPPCRGPGPSRQPDPWRVRSR